MKNITNTKLAVSTSDWLKHLDNLLLFWDKKEAYATGKSDLFPTYRCNTGETFDINANPLPDEIVDALNSEDTKGLIELDKNFIRAHSRQTYAYGIAFHMTGKGKYLNLCKKGVDALLKAIDGNYGMCVTQTLSGKWDNARSDRTSQDLAYGLTGLGMYYFLTHDKTILHRIIQLKDYIFNAYLSDRRGYLMWLPKNNPKSEGEVQIVAQLDQLYAYMLMLTPCLPEPYKSVWKKDMKKIADILITHFYSEKYNMFWGTQNNMDRMQLGTDHTDFGHSVKTFWVILKVGQLLGEPFYVHFARPNIEKILKDAFIPRVTGSAIPGSWARRSDANNELDIDKEWWILAELDQAAEILSIHDPFFYDYLNETQKYWLEVMTDKKDGEIWHMVDGKTNEPVHRFPKIHNWKTSLHSFEHVLFSYMTAANFANENFHLYYALPEWETADQDNVAPYMFFANVVKVEKQKSDIQLELPDNNEVYKVTFNNLH